MKQGKHICETLKSIRREIANANDIDYNPTECHHQGDCAGTCPKCESETQWLERQLRNRQALGKAVTIAGLGLALGALSSCNTQVGTPPNAGDVPDSSYCTLADSTDTPNTTVTTTDNSDTTAVNERITPLSNGNDNAAPKGNDEDDEDHQVMGEVAVDENGEIGEL